MQDYYTPSQKDCSGCCCIGLEVTLLALGEASGLAADQGESEELLLGGLH